MQYIFTFGKVMKIDEDFGIEVCHDVPSRAEERVVRIISIRTLRFLSCALHEVCLGGRI
jgi:hypothetical protein